MTFFKKIFLGKYVKDIITLSIGTIIAQLIMIVSSPLITRLYTPTQYGMYTLIMTIVSVIGPNINGRFDMAIVTSKDKKEADTLTVTSILFCLIMTILISIGLTLMYAFSPEMFTEIGPWVFILIPICLLSGLINTLLSYNNKYKQYKLIRSVSVMRSIVLSVGQVTFGFLSLGIFGLIISQVISLTLGVKKQAKYCLNNFKELLLVRKSDVLTVVKKYRNQPIYSFPANVLNALSYSLTYFFITGLYGVNEVGYYALCQTVLGLPITLICSNVSRVFFRQASESIQKEGSFFNVFKKTILVLSIGSIPIFLILFLFANELFAFVFGNGWGIAGDYAQIMAPMFAIRFITIPVISALIITGKQKVEFGMQITFIVFSILIYVFAKISSLPIETYLVLTSIMFSINYFVILGTIYRTSKFGVKAQVV
ncbi:oligosaccharide flippase family protein [Priestia filamentosa]|uniref:oligosaccharide flippase family protein n=1 Tax=Priestia filamentosa TaxID=1402861 RepID=UPI002894D467|nr:oligosaccharide flippase family protein [Priestia filamentosa]MDT3766199.1 oligosaccharide flippase family protein [Priestia filamentosa]